MAIMQPISLVVTAIMIASFAPSISGQQPKVFSQAAEDPAVRNALLASCQRKPDKCVGQTKEFRSTRQKIKSILVNGLRHQGDSLFTASRKAEAHLQKLYNLKKKMYEKTGLSSIDPADNGLLSGDIIYTEEQIDAISKSLDNPIPVSTTPGNMSNRGAAIYFEKYNTYRWRQMPIPYWISNRFRNYAGAIDQALQTITRETGCIKFQKTGNRIQRGSQIQFHRLEEGCHGYAYLGHVGPHINEVHLSVGKCQGDQLSGLIIHEVIHALGAGHEQSRKDRDYYIDIFWNNIDRANHDIFAIEKLSTSYGLPYTYNSIMQYHDRAFAIDHNRPTMRAKNNAKLGGDLLTPNDILQLKRMYCTKADCVDKHQDCGLWAVSKYCREGDYVGWMKKNCAKSCGLCDV